MDSIILKGTLVPDPDAPDDPESVRFWATSGGSMAEREKTKVSAAARASIETTGEGLASIVGPLDLPEMVSGRVAHGPSLKALVDVANSTAAPESTPAPKAKAKSKSRGDKQRSQNPG